MQIFPQQFADEYSTSYFIFFNFAHKRNKCIKKNLLALMFELHLVNTT